MPRLLIASLPWILACAPAARAPTNRAPDVVRYELVPVLLHGNEGRHSASHSSATVTGALEIAGSRAKLALEFALVVEHVFCPTQWQGDRVSTMQACAPSDAKDTQSRHALVFAGDARFEQGTWIANLRDETRARALELRCAQDFVGLSCTVKDIDDKIFGLGGERPRTMTFAAPGTRRWELGPVDVASVGQVAGSIEMQGATARIALWADGDAPVYLPGRVFRTSGGLVFSGQTSPTRTFSALCVGSSDALSCEVAADRSVLGKPEHVITTVTLRPQLG